MRRSLGLLGLTLALTSLSGVTARADAAVPECSTVITGGDADRRVVGPVVDHGLVRRGHGDLDHDP